MLAPSTVIMIGTCMYAPPMKFDGPMQMPLPPTTSIASMTTWRPRSVRCSLAMPEITAGFSPRSTAVVVSTRAASIMYRLPPIRASGSSIPSNLPIGVLNCVRTRAYPPVARTASFAMPVDEEGSEMPRPAARHSISIRQPRPSIG